MSFSELLDAVKLLPRSEQVSLMQSLKEEVGEASSDEELLTNRFPPGVAFEVYTPFDSGEAAAIHERMLAEEKASR